MIQFWGNFQLTDRNDKDNDGRIQLFPGGPGPYPGQGNPFTAPDPDLLNQSCVYDTPNNLMNGNLSTGQTCGGLVPKSYKEQNGMKKPVACSTRFIIFSKKRVGENLPSKLGSTIRFTKTLLIFRLH